jgi:hypothetical protein
MKKAHSHPWWGFVAGVVAILGTTSIASAQRVVVVGEGAGYDGPRLRAGISGGAGGLFLNGAGVGLVGLDGRIGVQLNNLIGIYAQPYVVGGGGPFVDNGTGRIVSFGADAVIDFTLGNRLFLGIGGGAGGTAIATNSTAAEEQLLFRVGFYPIVFRRFRHPGRSGLMLGLDVRPFFTSYQDNHTTLLQVTGNVGWELF